MMKSNHNSWVITLLSTSGCQNCQVNLQVDLYASVLNSDAVILKLVLFGAVKISISGFDSLMLPQRLTIVTFGFLMANINDDKCSTHISDTMEPMDQLSTGGKNS